MKPGTRKITFTAEEDQIITAHWSTHTREAIAAMLTNRSRDAVNRRGRILGLTRIPPARAFSAPQEAIRSTASRKPADSARDRDLIAAFLASKTVTVCPSGLAAGLSAMEGQFWTVGAGPRGWSAQRDAHHKNAGTSHE